jgi:hypothetical protein
MRSSKTGCDWDTSHVAPPPLSVPRRQVSSMRVLSSIPMFVFLKLWRSYEASE